MPTTTIFDGIYYKEVGLVVLCARALDLHKASEPLITYSECIAIFHHQPHLFGCKFMPIECITVQMLYCFHFPINIQGHADCGKDSAQ